MNKTGKFIWKYVRILLGAAAFSLGFDLFLAPHALNAGGISGLAQILVEKLEFGTVGMATALINLPLFAIGGVKVGKSFFWSSLVGMLALTGFMELFALLPVPPIDALLASLYGGVLCGVGLGTVFAAGASTGGSDIIVRLLKMKWEHVPIGIINICFDLTVAVLTGIAFHNISSALYSGVTIFVTGQVIDAVVYRFDYSKAVLIISGHHEAIAKAIMEDLDRGATYLSGEGTYSGEEKKVIFTVVKKQQVTELKRLVTGIDPDAFVVVQEAHQVLGEGFARYSKDSL